MARLLLELWQETRTDWGFVTDRLSARFRAVRLGSSERKLVSEALFGLVRHAGRVDAALTYAGYRTWSDPPDRERVIAYMLLDGQITLSDAQQASSRINWVNVEKFRAHAQSLPAVEKLSSWHSLPTWLAKKLYKQLGEEAFALAESLTSRAPMTIRANVLKNTRDELTQILANEGMTVQPGEYGPWALQVLSRTNLFGLTAFADGRFEAQDEGSQLLAELVAPPPGGLVVDYCAGAGGKTLALAGMLGGKGRLLAADIDSRKLQELKRRAKRAGATVSQIIELSPDEKSAFPKPLESVMGKVDRVLVDAPCSGIGALRRNPEAKYRLQQAELDRLGKMQATILHKAASLVKPGGRVIYATCTLLAEENQDIVANFLKQSPTFSVVPVKEIWGAARAEGITDSEGALRVTPQKHGTDGFFATILRRAK